MPQSFEALLCDLCQTPSRDNTNILLTFVFLVHTIRISDIWPTPCMLGLGPKLKGGKGTCVF